MYRVPSVPYLKARAGDLARSLVRGGGEEGRFTPARRAAGERGSSKDSPRPPRDEAARLAAAGLAHLATVNPGVRWLTGAALVAALPFPLEAKAQKAPKAHKAKAKPEHRQGAGAARGLAGH